MIFLSFYLFLFFCAHFLAELSLITIHIRQLYIDKKKQRCMCLFVCNKNKNKNNVEKKNDYEKNQVHLHFDVHSTCAHGNSTILSSFSRARTSGAYVLFGIQRQIVTFRYVRTLPNIILYKSVHYPRSPAAVAAVCDESNRHFACSSYPMHFICISSAH